MLAKPVTAPQPQKGTWSLILLAFALLCPSAVLAQTPIIARSAYQEFFNVADEPVSPNAAMIEATQQRLLDVFYQRLADTGSASAAVEIETRKKIIEQSVSDSVLSNALLIDQFLSAAGLESDSRLQSVHSALRRHYLNEIAQPSFSLPAGTFSKGIEPSIADALELDGIEVYSSTTASGSDYVAECAAAGVPIPPTMFQAPWENRGSFDGSEFISTGLDPELWLYESTSPQGLCLALPRYNASDDATLLGIICLGTQSNNACFWDNPSGVRFPRGVPVPLSSFVGGADLATNGQGECTDCHAGENPFNIHPEVAAFAGISGIAQPGGWHNPLVDPSWVQNPGPTNLLASVASTRSCVSCHQAGVSGRFPEVSTRLRGYCSDVLGIATRAGGGRPAFYTMPMGDAANGTDYENHIAALEAACDEPPASGTEEIPGGLDEDAGFLSRPIIVAPLYACASRITVRSTLLDAVVAVSVNGVQVTSVVSRDPDELVINLPNPMAVGETLTATQTLGGATSAPSDAVVVTDHTVDYPTGLPAPTIDPALIYECGNPIAVRHVPGASVTTWVNGGAATTRNGGGTGWTVFYPGIRPFTLGDKYTARQSLCTDVSPTSGAETATNAPTSILPPTLDPPEVYVNQELVKVQDIVNGSTVGINEAVAGPLKSFSTPVSWRSNVDVATPLGRPLQAGDSLTTEQTLCTSSGSSSAIAVKPCEDLPPPEIRRPVVGDDRVVVTSSLPGARIRVFDNTGQELGDSSGSVILLNRNIVAGDRLTVVQYLGLCSGQYAYFANAIEADTMSASKPNGEPDSDPTTDAAQLRVAIANTDAALGTVDVCFYEAEQRTLIGCDFGVAEGATASFRWQGLAGNTQYRWFAKAVNVDLEQARSETFAFTTQATSGPQVPTHPLALLLVTGTLLYTGWRRSGGS
jgi:hypothetical protein